MCAGGRWEGRAGVRLKLSSSVSDGSRLAIRSPPRACERLKSPLIVPFARQPQADSAGYRRREAKGDGLWPRRATGGMGRSPAEFSGPGIGKDGGGDLSCRSADAEQVREQ